MNVRIRELFLIPLCAAALVLTTAGFKSCSAAEKSSVERGVASGLDVSARAVAPGVETVRAFREAGKIESATSLKLARGALDTNSAARRLTEAALDGADAATLAERLDAVLDLAARLERDGTLHIKNEGTKLAFNLGVIAGRNGLVLARDRLKGAGGAPVAFSLDEETRRQLRDLLPVFEENDRLLREAVGRLERLQ